MSIRTAADEQLEKARDSIESAIHALDSIVIRQCGGSDEYKDTFMIALEKSLFSLIGIRKDLK